MLLLRCSKRGYSSSQILCEDQQKGLGTVPKQADLHEIFTCFSFHLGQAVAVCIALNSLFALFGCEVLTFVAQLYFAGGLADDFECSAKDCVHGCWILSFQASLAQKIKGLLN